MQTLAIHALVLSIKVDEWQTQVRSVALLQPPRSGSARHEFAQPGRKNVRRGGTGKKEHNVLG